MSARVPNCYDAIENLDEAVRPLLDPGQRYVMVGGIASGAIRHPGSHFSHSGQRLWAAEGSAEPIMRENGSVRDIDFLVCGILSEEQAADLHGAIAESIKKSIGTDMVVSVFGFDEREKLTAGKRAKSVVKGWTSDRTVDEHGVYRYELFPLETVVPASSYRPWMLALPSEAEVPILNPAGHYMAYRMRSISGTRYKDAKKVDQMEAKIMAEPQFVRDLTTGDFASWAEFASNLETFRKYGLHKHSSAVREGTGSVDLKIARLKARALAALESNETILNIAQQEWAQKILNFGVGAK